MTSFKMLGLYLYTLISVTNLAICILNKLTLQKELQNSSQKMCFFQKVKNTTTIKQKIKHKNPCLEPGIEPGTACTQSGCITTAPLSQLRVSIVVKLFNCFHALQK